jgi:Tfp pilus assembly protein PilF
VTVTFKINSPVGRIALATALLLYGVVCAGGIFSHYLVRTMADRRIAMGREAVAAAAFKLPNSPRIQFRLAEAEMADSAFNFQTLVSVQKHTVQAINHSPWDYRLWRLLAAAQEQDGKSEEAEKSLVAAAKLAPNNVEVKWTLANLLLRQGRVNESLALFSDAVKGNSELLPIALDLLWQASNGNQEILKTVAGYNAKSQLSLVQFLAEESQAEAAIQLYRSIDAGEKLKSSSAAAFISSLIRAEQFSAARELWLGTVRPLMGEMTADLIWNGGLEVDPRKEFSHFDWTISPSDYARIGLDPGVAHSGAKSLKLIFAGRDTTKLEGEIKQLVVLKPNTRYRLECYVKTANLITPEGPRLALLSQNRIVTVSEPVMGGSTEWQRLAGDFISPSQSAATFITIARLPRFSYDEPTHGTVWFDDFKLTEL